MILQGGHYYRLLLKIMRVLAFLKILILKIQDIIFQKYKYDDRRTTTKTI